MLAVFHQDEEMRHDADWLVCYFDCVALPRSFLCVVLKIVARSVQFVNFSDNFFAERPFTLQLTIHLNLDRMIVQYLNVYLIHLNRLL